MDTNPTDLNTTCCHPAGGPLQLKCKNLTVRDSQKEKEVSYSTWLNDCGKKMNPRCIYYVHMESQTNMLTSLTF